MNNIIKAATLFLVFISFAYPQFNSRRDSSFFPHKIGNVWFYQWNTGGGTYFNYSEKITADSVDKKGNTWLNINYDTMIKWSYKVSSGGDSVFYSPGRLNWLKYKKSFYKGEFWVMVDTPLDNRALGYVMDKGYVFFAGKFYMGYKLAFKREYRADTFSVGWANSYETYAEGIGRISKETDAGYAQLYGCILDGDSLGYIPVNVQNERKESFINNYYLSNNYPNPFNSFTKIEFNVKENCFVNLKVYDILGRVVKTLINEVKNPGNHTVEFDGSSLSSGTYFYELKAGEYREIRKMLLLK